jgi:iron complex transport system ATP-binding protein
MTLLSSTNLCVRIGGVEVCRGLDLALDAGQRWALLGANGAGKTTLLHTLGGLRPPQGGEIRVDGTPLATWPRKALACRVGVLFQDSQDTFPGTVLETALRGRHPHLPFWAVEGRTDLDLAHAALRDVQLEELAGRSVDTLSGGERRRLAIATLIAQQPDIWLLDEPTNHLDLRHQVTLLELIARRVTGRNGVMMAALHDVNLALRCCTHAALLLGAGEVLTGSADEVISEGNLERLYRHPVRCLRSEDGRRFYVPA